MEKVNWSLLHKGAFKIGHILSWPFRQFLLVTWIPPKRDIPDMWSYAHSLAAAFLTIVFSGLGLLWGWLIGNGIMFAYEIFIDGFQIEDERGASRADIGYNFIGATLAAGGLILRKVLFS